MSNYAQCGECDTRFPFDSLTGLEAALVAAEYEPEKHDNTGGVNCSAPNSNAEILLGLNASEYLVRFRRNEP